MTARMPARMTPVHPRWEEFSDRLCIRLAFEVDEDGVPVRWYCNHDHAHTWAALRAMDFDREAIEASLAYFREHGGFCDCEVVFNVPYPEFASDEDAAS